MSSYSKYSCHCSYKPLSARFPILTNQRPLSLPSFDASPIRNNGSAQSPGKSYYRRIKTINMLPDEVLLEIFDFSSIGHVTSLRPGSHWLTLVHVCQRWRHIVLVSPRRLDLTLYCTYGTPVRTHLGSFPPFPIIVDYFTSSQAFSTLRSPAPNHEDDIIAALENPDRVRSIKLTVTSHLLEMMTLVMQGSFPALTTLWLSSKDRNALVLPDAFSIGPAPCLSQILLEGISFPALPTLLLSANNLVDLQLKNIPQSGYISPEAMISSLAALRRLDNLCIWFKAPVSHLQLRHSFVSTRHVLLSLVTFKFHGSSEYLEHLLAQIDTPRLCGIDITYFNQFDDHIPQLSQFICRTKHLELARSQHMHGHIRISSLYVELDFEEEGHHGTRFTLRISCKWLDWQVLHLAQILGQSPAMVSNVEYLSIDENDLQIEPGWEDSMEDTDWLELFRSFTAVKRLHGSKWLAGHIALALDSVGGEMITDVLPALTSLSLEDEPVTSVEKFLVARKNSGHPVALVDLGVIQPSQALAESRRLWILKNAPNDYQAIYPSDADALVYFQSEHVPFTLGQQRLPGPPHDRESPPQPQVGESEMHLNDAFQFWRPSLAQSTGGASLGAAQLTFTQDAEPRQHSSAAGGKQYRSRYSNCVKNFTRPQARLRHIRAVHDSPPKCPFCPRTWKHAYLMKNHSINDHHEEFADDVL